ncbi:hypothetical protein [Polaribacter sp. Asnod1-A03]|uniref:hypothetical protein n=1 Tax=Polaribacter sp. Asnod1-A03 TaxID=3160581 RepID=UPI00386C6B3E
MIYKKTLLYDRERQHSFSAVRKIARENFDKALKEKQKENAEYAYEALETV